jgi:multidrug resistance efflux pump
MLIKFGLPVAAVLLLGFAIKNVTDAQKPLPKLPPPIQPARNPFPNTLAGAGIVEPETENITMGAPDPGVVVAVNVKVGQKVRPGDPLFRLDDRQFKAELGVRQAMLADARAQVARLEAMPRSEELPPAEATVREAHAEFTNMKDQLARGEKLLAKKAMSEEEVATRRQMTAQSRERYNKAVADYDLLKAGAWEHEKSIARAAVARVEAQISQTEAELDRLVVRALVDADVLQVNVRPGEFVGAPPANASLVVLGNIRQLHVRVDIDEYDIHRFRTDLPARATLKGDPKTSFPLHFVRVEPYVVPKRSLTGDNTERVDTRVLQVIYAIQNESQQLYVGQQLDVFVDASKTSG